MTTYITDMEANPVTVINDYTIEVAGYDYEIVGPSDPVYSDREYVNWNGGYWIKI